MKSTTDNNVAMLNERYFLKCLDFAQNPIVIWGEKTELLFANTAFCNLFHIPSREKAIGTTLADIMRKGKIKAIPVGSKRPGLKVPEVLQSGIEVLDWNVYLEYERSPNERQILSTDMYPIKDAADNVTGVIEIYRSHEQEIKSARKIMGLSSDTVRRSGIKSISPNNLQKAPQTFWLQEKAVSEKNSLHRRSIITVQEARDLLSL